MMTESEATTLIAALAAAFPQGSDRDETLHLYQHRLEPLPLEHGAAAVDHLIETRTSPFWPTWGELRQALNATKPPPKRRELTAGTMPPPAEFYAAQRELARADSRRALEMARGAGPLGWARRSGDTIRIVDRHDRVLWDYPLTGTRVDATELRWASGQWQIPFRTLERLANHATVSADA